MKIITKLRSLHLKGIKNIDDGKIEFYNNNGYLNVTGIYGQNGSGKTSVVLALGFIKMLLLGREMTETDRELFGSKDKASIVVEFEHPGHCIIKYSIEFSRKEGNLFVIESESISRSVKRWFTLVEYNRGSSTIFEETIHQFTGKSSYAIIEKNAIEHGTSIVFNEIYKDFLFQEKSVKFEHIKEIYSICQKFAFNLLIVNNRANAMVQMSEVLPMSIAFQQVVLGFLPMNISGEEIFFPAKFKDYYIKVIEQINIVLPALIPGLRLELLERRRQLTSAGDGEEITTELVANREGHRFPFRAESDGIKKLVGILSYIIYVYNNEEVILVVDELDAGIFEYLLGELIQIISESAKGQLVFTSHNLRVLEVLDFKKIVLTTTNPENRYIRLKQIKTTNNVRDVYLRTIIVGGAQEELYQETRSSDIKRAIRKAGRLNEKE